ncbi:transglutaminase family protein [Segnochrobactraceae bacterium EtOH-i3]
MIQFRAPAAPEDGGTAPPAAAVDTPEAPVNPPRAPLMRYDIVQVTAYDYASQVPLARHVVRMLPVNRPGVTVLSAEIEVEPVPSDRHDGTDFFGNSITWITHDTPHDRLVVTGRLSVEVTEPELPDPERTPDWEIVRELAFADEHLGADSPVHQLFASRHIVESADITAYVAESFPAHRPILAGAIELMRRIHKDFTYDSTATDVSTPAREAFRLKKGVCQDFAHVMIAGLRGIGLPASYVSGFLRTVPPPGQPRLVGADATHAWVRVWCGPEDGWIGLDPTNALVENTDHVVLGIGRDYADVAPVDGVIVGAGTHTLHTSVDVVPHETPADPEDLPEDDGPEAEGDPLAPALAVVAAGMAGETEAETAESEPEDDDTRARPADEEPVSE